MYLMENPTFPEETKKTDESQQKKSILSEELNREITAAYAKESLRALKLGFSL